MLASMIGFAVLLCTVVFVDPAFAADAISPAALATERARSFERSIMAWRLAIVVGAMVLVALPRWLPRFATESRRSHLETARITLLLFLGLAAFASYYDFFRPKPGIGFKDTDVFHYYMGSKYFAQVGYFDLYPCTLMALVESGVESNFSLPDVRDQRTLRIHTPETALAAAHQCRSQFSDERWQKFRADIAWFAYSFQPRQWRVVLLDHGYNPSPVWNAIGGAVTSRVELASAGFDWLIRVDRLLIGAALLLVVWAFGLEVAALAAIVWGTGQHWAYSWIGDSLLRNLWFFGVIAGLCLLKKRKDELAGAFLTLASLLRVFPAVFIAGFALGAGFVIASGRELRSRAQPFATGAVVAGVTLIVFAGVSSAWGAAAFLEFYDKISVFTDQKSLNKIGLSSLIWRSIMVGTGHLVTNAEGHAILTHYSPPWMPYVIRGGQLLVVVPALWFFWRGAQRLRMWEVSALGFALIPLLSNPANYYFCFVVCGALLAIERPRLQLALLAACGLWIGNALVYYRIPEEYLGAGVVAVGLPLFFLYVLSRDDEVSAPAWRERSDPGA